MLCPRSTPSTKPTIGRPSDDSLQNHSRGGVFTQPSPAADSCAQGPAWFINAGRPLERRVGDDHDVSDKGENTALHAGPSTGVCPRRGAHLQMGLCRTLQRRCQFQKSKQAITPAACSGHRHPPLRTYEGTGRSSIRSRPEHRTRYHGAWHGAPAHWASSALGRSCRCSTEAR